jgi:sporulation protein YlmC with PRC-barrel domain
MHCRHHLNRLLVATALAASIALPAQAGDRASDLLGRIVETRDGQELGRVTDFSLRLDDGRIEFVVVSVGSFLIEDSLIAVAADALRASADPDRRLVLEASAERVRRARRFGPGNWPEAADVLRETDAEAPPLAARDREAAPSADSAPGRGSAVISDGRRTATLSAGERRIEVIKPPPEPAGTAKPPAGAAKPQPPERATPEPTSLFDRLDRNRDGVLDRAEIAHELGRDDSFSDIDLNRDGVIDREEFERFRPENP